MTPGETLHRLVDQFRDEQAEAACVWLEDLRNAADSDGPVRHAAATAWWQRDLPMSATCSERPSTHTNAEAE